MKLYISKPGDSVRSAACRAGLSPAELLFFNALSDPERLTANLALLCPEKSPSERISFETFASAVPGLSSARLARLLPVLSFFSAARLNINGTSAAAELILKENPPDFFGALPVLTLTNLDSDGRYSPAGAHVRLYSEESRRQLCREVLSVMTDCGCTGLYLELLHLFPFDLEAYGAAIEYLAPLLHERGYFLLAVLSAADEFESSSAYCAHCLTLQRRADRVVLTGGGADIFGPPGPVFSLYKTRLAAEAASRYISPGKLLLSFPDFALDWTMPWRHGDAAEPMSGERAVCSAVSAGAGVKYRPISASCSYTYTDPAGLRHSVYFQDGRSFLSFMGFAAGFKCAGIAMGSLCPGTAGRLLCAESSLCIRKFM